MFTRKGIGSLYYNEEMGRMDIRFGSNDYYGGLHCGDCFEVLINQEWVHSRIEMAEMWYLVGVDANNIEGLVVKME